MKKPTSFKIAWLTQLQNKFNVLLDSVTMHVLSSLGQIYFQLRKLNAVAYFNTFSIISVPTILRGSILFVKALFQN